MAEDFELLFDLAKGGAGAASGVAGEEGELVHVYLRVVLVCSLSFESRHGNGNGNGNSVLTMTMTMTQVLPWAGSPCIARTEPGPPSRGP